MNFESKNEIKPSIVEHPLPWHCHSMCLELQYLILYYDCFACSLVYIIACAVLALILLFLVGSWIKETLYSRLLHGVRCRTWCHGAICHLLGRWMKLVWTACTIDGYRTTGQKTEKSQCFYLLIWMGEKGRQIFNTFELEKDQVNKV